MKKQDNSVRVDVRIPEDIYSEIEKIAIATNQPYTPKSKNSDNPKPVVTPIILKLIELGLDSLARQGLELDNKEISDLEADIKLTDLEDRIVKRLESHLRKLVDEQVIEAISQYEHFSKILEDEDLNIALNQLSDISDLGNDEDNESLEDITPENNESLENNSLDEEINEDVSALENNSELNEIIEAKLSDNSETKEVVIGNGKESINETNEIVSEDNSEIKSFDEAVIEIKRLKKQGLGNTAIAKELTGKYFTKQGKTKWSDTQVRRILS